MNIREWSGMINTRVNLYQEWKAITALYSAINRPSYLIAFDIEHDILTEGNSNDVLYVYYDGTGKYYVDSTGNIIDEATGEILAVFDMNN